MCCQVVEISSASGGKAPLTRGFAPGPHREHSPQTPKLGSRSAFAMNSPPPVYKLSGSCLSHGAKPEHKSSDHYHESLNGVRKGEGQPSVYMSGRMYTLHFIIIYYAVCVQDPIRTSGDSRARDNPARISPPIRWGVSWIIECWT